MQPNGRVIAFDRSRRVPTYGHPQRQIVEGKLQLVIELPHSDSARSIVHQWIDGWSYRRIARHHQTTVENVRRIVRWHCIITNPEVAA